MPRYSSLQERSETSRDEGRDNKTDAHCYIHPDRRVRGEKTFRSRDRSRSPHSFNHSSESRASRSKRHTGYGVSRRRYDEARRSPSADPSTASSKLPFDASPLNLREFDQNRRLFGLYLDVQKNLDISQLPEREVLGRWKSFVKKWNHGDLAASWYNPEIVHQLQATRAQRDEEDEDQAPDFYNDIETPSVAGSQGQQSRNRTTGAVPNKYSDAEDLSRNYSSDDSIGPRLPGQREESSHSRPKRSGPAIPSVADLQLRNEMIDAETKEDREAAAKDRMISRAADKALARDRLDEIAPRAEANTRERKLENKRLRAESNREFANAKQGEDEEMGDDDLMGGGGDDGLARLKALEKAKEKKKTDRQIRREEMFRARAAERESRLKASRERENRTMEMLQALAKSRFG